MSGRNLSAAMQAELAKSTVHPVFFVKSEFNDGDVFLWSGRGVISWNGETWTGSGKLMSISGIKESTDIKVSELIIDFEGLSAEYKAIALGQVQGKNQVTIWFGFVDSSLSVIATPEQVYKGYMDEMILDESTETGLFSLSVVNRFVSLQGASNARYTNQDQVKRFPLSTALRHVPNTTKVIKWGTGL